MRNFFEARPNETPKEHLRRLDKRINMIFLPIVIGFLILVLCSCKKDTPPAPAIIPLNTYRMDIEITDNDPFDNVSALFWLGRENTIQNQNDSTHFKSFLITPNIQINQPDYSFRFLEYTDSVHVPIIAACTNTSTSEDNFKVIIWKNGVKLYEFSGHQLDELLTIN